jgi:starch phosphorylase
LGDGQEHGGDPDLDAREADALYDLLENEVIPAFYTRDSNGIPTAWVARMRESMARLTPQFSASRTVREYTEHHYLPAAAAYRARVADGGAIGRQVVDWQNALEEKWAALRFEQVTVETNGEQHHFEAYVYLGGLDQEVVRVELYAERTGDGAPMRHAMRRVQQPMDESTGYTYHAQVPATRAAEDYTVRVIPHLYGAAVPLEDAHVLWQR